MAALLILIKLEEDDEVGDESAEEGGEAGSVHGVEAPCREGGRVLDAR